MKRKNCSCCSVKLVEFEVCYADVDEDRVGVCNECFVDFYEGDSELLTVVRLHG